MGDLAESQFSSSITALQKSDQDLVDKIIGKDDRVDEFEKKIEAQVIDLIALRQPLAIDLRETVSAMKISSELERIGDLSKNIAKRSRILKLTLDPKIATDIKNSAEFVQKNLKLTMDAYAKRSAESALEVWGKDKEIDDSINLLMEELLKFMKLNKKNLEDVALSKINEAYQYFYNINVLDISKEGNEQWDQTERTYNLKIDKVESQITSILKAKLSHA
jgi:phosphate transport system protein